MNIEKAALRAGINAGIMRQYESQAKYPSAIQARKIEDTIHKLAADMSKALVHRLAAADFLNGSDRG